MNIPFEVSPIFPKIKSQVEKEEEEEEEQEGEREREEEGTPHGASSITVGVEGGGEEQGTLLDCPPSITKVGDQEEVFGPASPGARFVSPRTTSTELSHAKIFPEVSPPLIVEFSDNDNFEAGSFATSHGSTDGALFRQGRRISRREGSQTPGGGGEGNPSLSLGLASLFSLLQGQGVVKPLTWILTRTRQRQPSKWP